MRKIAMVLVAVLVLCSVAMADWAADWTAWKAQTPAVRYTVEVNGKTVAAPHSAPVYQLVATAPVAELGKVAEELKATAFDSTADILVRRGTVLALSLANDRLMADAIKRGDKPQALAVWTEIGALADGSRQDPILVFTGPAITMRLNNGNSLVQAKYLEADDLVNDLAPRLVLMNNVEVALRYKTLPKALVPKLPEVLAYTQLISAYAEELPYCLTYLSNAYAQKTLSAADYATALKGVIITSVNRLTTLAKDNPTRQKLLDAISGVKTSLKQLMEIEGTL